MNLYDYLLNGDDTKIAILSRHEKLSYAELRALTESIAHSLMSFNIQKAERIAIMAENSAFWVAAYLAILKIGAIAVPIPQRLSEEAFLKIVELMGISAFCIDETRLSTNQERLPIGAKLLVPNTDTPLELQNKFRILSPIPNTTTPTAAIQERQDLAALMFTSGSDGQPNAVKVSHRNIMANTDSIVNYLELSTTDSIMVVLPFDYCFGTSLLHTHLHVGGTLVINNSFTFIETVLEDMVAFQCTGFAGVPTVYQQLLRGSSLSRHDLSRLRYAQQAGGRLPDIFIRQFMEALPHTRFFVMYGQTEATARLSYLPPERLSVKLGSIGRGISGVKLQVVDSSGQEVKLGEIGEIVAEGDNICTGYWLPDPRKQPFRDGKLYTGDLARIDEDGFIYVMGRNSEFLKLNGHRISSTEIEDILFDLPEILEAAVVASQDAEFGEIAKAYLVLRNNAEITSDAIVKHCKRRLPAYAIPRKIEFLSEMPKNAAGKILKSALRAKE